MEIDEINLEDEQTSQVLLKYLNGEIPFHEWLNLQSGGNSNSDVFDAEIENTADGNVNEITDCNDDFKSALPPTTASVDALDEGLFRLYKHESQTYLPVGQAFLPHTQHVRIRLCLTAR